MKPRRHALCFVWVVTCLLAATAAHAAPPPFTSEFLLDDCTFSSSGRNAYFSLVPGDRHFLVAEEDGELTELLITVLSETKTIRFTTAEGDRLRVTTRVIEERESIDGELFEISRNYYARCKETGEIYYFGEDVDFYEDGEIVGHDGAWRAGVDGAQPGLIMPATYLLGSRYFQEVAPGIALDRAEHTAMGLEIEVPAGEFDGCVEVTETTPLEPGSVSLKFYCEEVGFVGEASGLELVWFDVEED